MYDIKNLFLFENLTDADWRKIMYMLEAPVRFSRGDIIYGEDSFRRAIGVFISGKGAAYEGKALKTSFAGGGVFGAAAVFGAGDSYDGKIIAVSDCRVLFIDEKLLGEIIGTYPACAVNYIRFLSDKVRYLNSKIAEYTGDCSSSRLYRLLTDKADEDGRLKDVNVSALAKLAGMGRTSAYRALAELEEKKMLTRDGKTIIIKK